MSALKTSGTLTPELEAFVSDWVNNYAFGGPNQLCTPDALTIARAEELDRRLRAAIPTLLSAGKNPLTMPWQDVLPDDLEDWYPPSEDQEETSVLRPRP